MFQYNITEQKEEQCHCYSVTTGLQSENYKEEKEQCEEDMDDYREDYITLSPGRGQKTCPADGVEKEVENMASLGEGSMCPNNMKDVKWFVCYSTEYYSPKQKKQTLGLS